MGRVCDFCGASKAKIPSITIFDYTQKQKVTPLFSHFIQMDFFKEINSLNSQDIPAEWLYYRHCCEYHYDPSDIVRKTTAKRIRLKKNCAPQILFL